MLQVTIDLASHIDVPASDVAEGRVYALPAQDTDGDEGLPPLVRVHSSKLRPGNAHVAIRYRNHWFWIDDRDFPSKRMLMFYMILSSLTETGAPQAAPIVTVPTN